MQHDVSAGYENTLSWHRYTETELKSRLREIALEIPHRIVEVSRFHNSPHGSYMTIEMNNTDKIYYEIWFPHHDDVSEFVTFFKMIFVA